MHASEIDAAQKALAAVELADRAPPATLEDVRGWLRLARADKRGILVYYY